MITKTFTFDPAVHMSFLCVDNMVTRELKDKYQFDSYDDTCLVVGDTYQTYAKTYVQCPTPPALLTAVTESDKTTFSVTLPAKYWRNP
jgi:hypothetical protein